MLAKNLGVHRGLVNGARGVVVGFEPGTKGQCQIIFASRFFIEGHNNVVCQYPVEQVGYTWMYMSCVVVSLK